MFERFTEEARRAIILAQEESRLLNHDYIGSEHLLLGLLHDQVGMAAAALASLSVGLAPAREAIVERVGRGDGASPNHIPFTPQAKATLEQSLREALRLGHDHIGSEHLLLGLVADVSRLACRILADLGAAAEVTRERVLILIARPSAEAPSPPLVFLLGPGGADLLDIGDRLTTTARQALAVAQGTAARAKAPRTDLDHLLLALLDQDESFAGFLLRAAGADPDSPRNALTAGAKPPPHPFDQPPGPSGWLFSLQPLDQPTVAPDLAEAIRLAAAEADGLGDTAISTAHLLLGISGVPSATASILDGAGVSAETLRRLLAPPERPS